MDLFRKFLGIDQEHPSDDPRKKRQNEEARGNKQQSPWFDDDELFDNKTFGFRVFTNPGELHEHLEKQMEEVMKLFDENSETFSNFTNEDFHKLKPGFKQHIEDFHKQFKERDSDLDGKEYSEQLKTLLDRIAPEQPKVAPLSPIRKRTEDEEVMDRIHGTHPVPTEPLMKPRPRRKVVASPHHIPNGVFDGNGPRVFGQSIISQTIRRPDGSVETRRTVRDSDGHTKTTITRSENGQTVQQITTYDEEPLEKRVVEKTPVQSSLVDLDRNLAVTPEGYTLPRNLW